MRRGIIFFVKMCGGSEDAAAEGRRTLGHSSTPATHVVIFNLSRYLISAVCTSAKPRFVFSKTTYCNRHRTVKSPATCFSAHLTGRSVSGRWHFSDVATKRRHALFIQRGNAVPVASALPRTAGKRSLFSSAPFWPVIKTNTPRPPPPPPYQ